MHSDIPTTAWRALEPRLSRAGLQLGRPAVQPARLAKAPLPLREVSELQVHLPVHPGWQLGHAPAGELHRVSEPVARRLLRVQLVGKGLVCRPSLRVHQQLLARPSRVAATAATAATDAAGASTPSAATAQRARTATAQPTGATAESAHGGKDHGFRATPTAGAAAAAPIALGHARAEHTELRQRLLRCRRRRLLRLLRLLRRLLRLLHLQQLLLNLQLLLVALRHCLQLLLVELLLQQQVLSVELLLLPKLRVHLCHLEAPRLGGRPAAGRLAALRTESRQRYRRQQRVGIRRRRRIALQARLWQWRVHHQRRRRRRLQLLLLAQVLQLLQLLELLHLLLQLLLQLLLVLLQLLLL